MYPHLIIVGSILFVLLLFIVWKRVLLSWRVRSARQVMIQLVEPYLNMTPLFFTIYEKYIPKDAQFLKGKANSLLIMYIQSEMEGTVEILHFLEDMEQLLEKMATHRALADNAQFQLVEQDFKSKHQQIRSSIYALELHGYFHHVKVMASPSLGE